MRAKRPVAASTHGQRPPLTFVAEAWTAPEDQWSQWPESHGHERWLRAWDDWFRSEGIEGAAMRHFVRLALKHGRAAPLTSHGYDVLGRRRAELGLTGWPEGIAPPPPEVEP